jgi:glycerophosphoryl diester phosphodiesterase
MDNIGKKVGQIISHRGASAYAPENTIASFQKAIDLGGKIVEFDVSQSFDGELFIFHDAVLNRTTNGVGYLHNVDAKYVASLDAGGWFAKKYLGLKVPTFKETIEWLLKNNMQANIEIKTVNGNVLQITSEVLLQLDKYWPKNQPQPLISSFDYDALLFCHNYDHNLPLAWLLDKWDDNWLELAQKINCIALNLSYRCASKKRVAAILQHGYKVNVYTVNSKRLAVKLFNWGVSAVISDYPDLMTKI